LLLLAAAAHTDVARFVPFAIFVCSASMLILIIL
jgi:hypothetical protein